VILANPLGLLGLFSLPVILALHLVSSRQPRYIVSHLRLWEFLQVEARSPRLRRLPLTWILFLDLLAAALFSLAWAQPQLALAHPATRSRQLVILLDVSTSMRARDGLTTRLDEAKAQAAQLLAGRSDRDVVTVVTFGREATVLADSRRDGVSRVLDQVQTVRAGATGSALREALALGEAALDRSLPADFYILTDGDFPELALDGFAYPVHWMRVGQGSPNQAVITANTTSSSAGHVQMFARIANFSSQAVTRTVELAVDGRVVAQDAIQIPADASVVHVWQVPLDRGAKPESVSVALQGVDSLPEDDAASVGLQPGNQVRVALVSDQPTVIQQAVQADPRAELKVFSTQDYQAGSLNEEQVPFDLLIFRGFIPDPLPSGQVLVIDPTVQGGSLPIPDTGQAAFGAFSSQSIPAGAVVQVAADPLVAGIDFSGVRWSRAWKGGLPGGFSTLVQAGDTPLLLRGEIPAGASGVSHVLLLLADLSQGNFTRTPAFPILVANIVESASQAPLPASFKTGAAPPLPALGSYRSIEVTPPGGAPAELETSVLAGRMDTLEPGVYRFRLTRPDGEVSAFSAGANAGDAAESDLRARPWWGSLGGGNGQSGQAAPPPDRAIDLRPWLLGAAILALVLEAGLAWRR
jgi:Ca-activated chloride channel homolog